MSAKVRQPNGQVVERSGTFYIRYYRTNVEVGKQVRSWLSERLCDKGQVRGWLGSTAEGRSRSRPNQSTLVGGDLLATNFVPYPAAMGFS
jgi:hypothetical protein